MAKIIVKADEPTGEAVLLEESVSAVHLSTGHAADQLIERLNWALGDAEELERVTQLGRGGQLAPTAG
ncbi:MAG TPA: hypothetical protein VG188_07980 [Solirubrobacteraceae bacterium]|jgi:hypothetical protein|nr:hypothetical protein [Solirubrobacteraceae bacterium]